jgi:hypothetical protein
MRQLNIRRAGIFAAATALVTGLLTVTGVGTGSAEPSIQAQLAQVRAATAAFHSIAAAENDGGYVKALPCFDDATLGGMGQHWLKPALFAQPLDIRTPAALVYEPEADGSYRLVAVEYVVPGPSDMDAPHLLGKDFTYLPSLGVWKLHAWIWRPNPSGMFKDYNPTVNMCPTA